MSDIDKSCILQKTIVHCWGTNGMQELPEQGNARLWPPVIIYHIHGNKRQRPETGRKQTFDKNARTRTCTEFGTEPVTLICPYCFRKV